MPGRKTAPGRCSTLAGLLGTSVMWITRSSPPASDANVQVTWSWLSAGIGCECVRRTVGGKYASTDTSLARAFSRVLDDQVAHAILAHAQGRFLHPLQGDDRRLRRVEPIQRSRAAGRNGCGRGLRGAARNGLVANGGAPGELPAGRSWCPVRRDRRRERLRPFRPRAALSRVSALPARVWYSA